MAREFELRELLKSQSLDNVQPSAFATVGGVVFPDQPAKFDLADFVDVVDSYRAVHVPTYGQAIPNTTATTANALGTTKTSVDLLTVPDNQTYRILGISVRNTSNFEMTAAALAVDGVNILDLANIDTLTATFSGVIVDNQFDLIITGGAVLSFLASANPNDDVVFDIVYHVLQQ
jgi:hypothetical protein